MHRSYNIKISIFMNIIMDLDTVIVIIIVIYISRSLLNIGCVCVSLHVTKLLKLNLEKFLKLRF